MKVLRLVLLAGGLMAGACSTMNAAYDEAARRECERQLNTQDRLACQQAAEESARERRAERTRTPP